MHLPRANSAAILHFVLLLVTLCRAEDKQPEVVLSLMKDMLRKHTLPADVWGFARGGPLNRYSLDKFVNWAANNLTQAQRNKCAEWGPINYCNMLQCTECWDMRYSAHGFNMNTASKVFRLNLDKRRKPAHAGGFDTIIATQVFEHVHAPAIAARNIHSLLKPGGHVLLTVPFLERHHNIPYDNYRYTVAGCIALFEAAGFQLREGFVFGDLYTTVATLLGFGIEDFTTAELDAVYMKLADWQALHPGRQKINGVNDFYIQTLLVMKRI